MDRESFEIKIKQGLKKLNKEQVVYFTWICAVRSLPFLGNLDLWNEKVLQKYLYNIFHTLDIIASYNLHNSNVVNKIPISKPEGAIDSYALKAINVVNRAIDVAIAARSDIDAARIIASACATYVVNVFKSKVNLESIILKDLREIRSSKERIHAHPLVLYGSVWNVFLKALEKENCAFWGQLYQTIFEDGLILNDEALLRRINVPNEIQEQGAAIVANYLEALEKEGEKRLNEARILILGEKGAGKTCLARRLINPDAPMTTDAESTPGVDTTLWKLEEENINVHIWDFAGHTVTHAVHQFFLSERCLYIIVYDGRSEERNRLEYWLNHMKNFGGDSKAIILVNTRDRHRMEVPINILKEQYPIIDVWYFSIRDDKAKLKDFRNEVAGLIQSDPSWSSQLIPANYYKVKNDLEEIFVNGKKEGRKERITREEFETIAKKYGEDNFEDLLTHLHALGISLWYKDMEQFNTLVLNPEWISDGVYKIINWANDAKKHCLTIGDFTKVFETEPSRYPEDQFKFLFELMKKYELAYEAKEGNTLIIPRLLKEDRPSDLPDFPFGESLLARYKADQPLLPDTISRFIVRHNEQIKKERNYLVWRSGVVLDDNIGNTALVREEDRTITIAVKGPDKTNYISTLRETLDEIFNSYKSKKPELQFRIEQLAIEPGNKPVWISENEIINHAIAGKKSIYSSFLDQEIPTQIIIQNFYNSGSGAMFIAHNLDNSTHITFNFYDCNISLQGSLNDLTRRLTKANKTEEVEELKEIVELLEEAENCKTPEEVKKKGIARSLKCLAENLGNEDSKLHKTVEGIKEGIGIAQDIAKGYNDIAQWMGLPQVPKPFLKKE